MFRTKPGATYIERSVSLRNAGNITCWLLEVGCHQGTVSTSAYCSTLQRMLKNILEKMFWLKWWADSFLGWQKRQLANSLEKHVPLCVPISFHDTPKQIYFSIYEPTLDHYSCLGRVMVTDNSLHCPCAKARLSCVHKNISKWHLLQSKLDMFKTQPASTTTTPQYRTLCIHHWTRTWGSLCITYTITRNWGSFWITYTITRNYQPAYVMIFWIQGP